MDVNKIEVKMEIVATQNFECVCDERDDFICCIGDGHSRAIAFHFMSYFTKNFLLLLPLE